MRQCSPGIAIVGLACRYADASTPRELFENALAQRRAFRRIPAERMRLDDYYSSRRSDPDATYLRDAALIEGYEFDRERFKIPGAAFRASDMAHWLALDVAAQALADAGLPGGDGLPRETTGVLVGNTLTGDQARAQILRLRWPYVRRVLDGALREEAWSSAQRGDFLARLEQTFKAPFAPSSDESLAGGLSNTIAGRICNHFDLKGGGFTVDGACASSLLAVTSACSSLVAGDLDAAIVGGVDLSIDPFELVGFARLGALATGDMRVFDARPEGFLPGEGCGFAVLMRAEDAAARGLRVYAVIRGWGVSSDGNGGITRPEVAGQRLALLRAYRRAGFGPETVACFEAHGSGTEVGDATELAALCSVREEGSSSIVPAALGSIKANIGHTKAAAGIAGLIKTALAIEQQILPPATGFELPHPRLAESGAGLELLARAERWPAERPLRGGVSAMGFGGINSHIVVEGVSSTRRRAALTHAELRLARSVQDCELLMLGAETATQLASSIDDLIALAPGLSWSELGDLAHELHRAGPKGELRAAVVATRPAELMEKLAELRTWISEEPRTRLDVRRGIFLGAGSASARVGFLFPGQGAPTRRSGGPWARRFEVVERLFEAASLPRAGDDQLTSVAQPAIVAASLAGLRVLDQLGVEACIAVGHSLGELSALCWAGALDEPAVVRLAAARGRAMAERGEEGGAMASLVGENLAELVPGSNVVVAAYNTVRSIVVSGRRHDVERLVARAQSQGIVAKLLPVSHAFHSPLVAGAVPELRRELVREELHPLRGRVVSTVTARVLQAGDDLRDLLARQVTEPVRFADALAVPEADVDLWIEVGPGTTLGSLLASRGDVPVASLDVGAASLQGLLCAAGACFVTNACDPALLFDSRLTRPFERERKRSYFTNPCEHAPLDAGTARASLTREAEPAEAEHAALDGSALEIVRTLIARTVDLPAAVVAPRSRLLADLHLNSIAVAEVAARGAKQLGRLAPLSLTSFASFTVEQLASALEQLPRADCDAEDTSVPAGVDAWTQVLQGCWIEQELTAPRGATRADPAAPAGWELFAADAGAWDPAERRALEAIEGGGVAVRVEPELTLGDVDALLAAARAVVEGGQRAARFVLVQHGGGAASFARSVHAELGIATCAIDLPAGCADSASWLGNEVASCAGYREARYERDGKRSVRVLERIDVDAQAPAYLGPADVMLVTGGGKGITAECALHLAKTSGARLALIGRSRPEDDPELLAQLERTRSFGVAVHYAPADVQDAVAVERAVRACEQALGPITAVLHGAGSNEPTPLRELDRERMLRALGPKVAGLDNVLAVLPASRLRLLVTFGSIIAEIGLAGEAHYALANERLARRTEEWSRRNPGCRSLCVAWSVWSGIGMGERLGSVDALARQGIDAIPPARGVEVLAQLVRAPLRATTSIVTGRFGAPATVALAETPLPLWRFLERPRLQYPGIELICDAVLTSDTDPYLADHRVDGRPVLPAVLGLEAIAQSAMALLQRQDLVAFENVEFLRPVVVPEDSPLVVRLAALRRAADLVEVILHTDQTRFQAAHFRALCRFGARCPVAPPAQRGWPAELVPLDPERELYGSLLFHQGRFRRLRGYRKLGARECIAEIGGAEPGTWFSAFHASTLLLGDPAARDAAIHAIQACIPHVTVLPVKIARVLPGTPASQDASFVHAAETLQDGDRYVYDVEILSEGGERIERWEGLELHKLADRPHAEPWPAALLGPYLARRAETAGGFAKLSVTVIDAAAPRGQRRAISDRAICEALGFEQTLRRRSDGKPELPQTNGLAVSASHHGNLTLAVAAPERVACDLQPIERRAADTWRALLGAERAELALLIARESGETLDTSATRVWTALECLKKIEAGPAPLRLGAISGNGWISLEAGLLTCVTALERIREAGPAPMIVAIAAEVTHAGV